MKSPHPHCAIPSGTSDYIGSLTKNTKFGEVPAFEIASGLLTEW